MSKMREKESLECVRMHIWALKTQKLLGPVNRPWSPATDCSLRSRDSASLHRQLSASEAGPPPLDQILDPHLKVKHFPNPIKASWVYTWKQAHYAWHSIVLDSRSTVEIHWLRSTVEIHLQRLTWYFRQKNVPDATILSINSLYTKPKYLYFWIN